MAPTRRPGTPPVVTVEVSPAYELLQSIPVTMEGNGGDTYDVGDAWIEEAESRAGTELMARVRAVSHENADTWMPVRPNRR